MWKILRWEGGNAFKESFSQEAERKKGEVGHKGAQDEAGQLFRGNHSHTFGSLNVPQRGNQVLVKCFKEHPRRK